MEKPTLIQKIIENTVTNGIGYSKPMPYKTNKEIDIELHLGMLEFQTGKDPVEVYNKEKVEQYEVDKQ